MESKSSKERKLKEALPQQLHFGSRQFREALERLSKKIAQHEGLGILKKIAMQLERVPPDKIDEACEGLLRLLEAEEKRQEKKRPRRVK